MPEENVKSYVPIYYGTPEEAYSHGYDSDEGKAFRASLNATVRCTRDIQKTVDTGDRVELLTSPKHFNALMEKHGRDRMAYVLASAVRMAPAEYFTGEDRAWARGVRISDSLAVSRAVPLEIFPGMMQQLIDVVEGRKSPFVREDDMETNEEVNQNSIIKPSPDTQKLDRVTENGDGSITVTMPMFAVIRRYSGYAVLTMPRGQGYDGFRYAVHADNLSQTGENVSVVFKKTPQDFTVKRRGEEKTLSLDELREVFKKSEDSDFEPVRYKILVPKDAEAGVSDAFVKVRMPDNSRYAGGVAFIPAALEDTYLGDESKRVFSVPDYMDIGMKMEGSDIRVPAEEFAGIMSSAEYKKRTVWETLEISSAAIIQTYDKQSYMRMPKGGYGGYAYYIPNGMIERHSESDKTLTVHIPSKRMVTLKNITGEKVELTALQLKNLVSGKEADAYPTKSYETKMFSSLDPEGSLQPIDGSEKR